MRNTDMTTEQAINFRNLWLANNQSFGEVDVIVERTTAAIRAEIAAEKPTDAQRLFDGDNDIANACFAHLTRVELRRVEESLDAELSRRGGNATCWRLVNATTGEAVDARIVDGKFGRVWKITKHGGLCEFVDTVKTILGGATVKGYRAERVEIPCTFRFVGHDTCGDRPNMWRVEVRPTNPADGQRW